MSTPPTLGPMILVKLKAAELSATAFIRSSRGATSGTSAWRTGSLKDHTTPVTRVKANRCQTSSRSRLTTAPMPTEVSRIIHWVPSMSRRRSVRSAATPASGLKRRKGMVRRPLTAPRSTDERVIS